MLSEINKNKPKSLAQIAMGQYKESRKEAKKIADLSLGPKLVEERKNILRLYSIPACAALSTVGVGGIIFVNDNLIVVATATVCLASTVVSIMIVKKSLKKAKDRFKSLKREYNEIIDYLSIQKPTKKQLEVYKQIETDNVSQKTLALRKKLEKPYNVIKTM